MNTTRFAVVLVLLTSSIQANIQFTLLPSNGNVAGPAGSLVGWGYSLMNTDPSNWFVATDLNSDSFANGTPTLLFDFPILGPGGSVTEPFNPATGVGLFDLMWDPAAPVGFVNSGDFTLSGEWWDGDPLKGGNFIADAPDTLVAYSATVTTPLSGVPEPSSFTLLVSVATLLGICWLVGRIRRFRAVRAAPLAVMVLLAQDRGDAQDRATQDRNSEPGITR